MWRRVLALLAVMLGVVLLASGCGTTEASDPFTGSWSPSGKAPATAVISQSGDGYHATLLAYALPFNTLLFKRNGDRLQATVIVKEGPPYSWNIVVERRDGSDKLFWTEGGGTMPLSRVSDSTALPSASPTVP
jgi:uncharacterized protein YceK